LFNSVVYLKKTTIYEEKEKLYKVVKVLEVRPKKLIQAKWDFEETVCLRHDLLKHKGKFKIFQATDDDFSYNFFFADPISV
jgi:hypothetical protein